MDEPFDPAAVESFSYDSWDFDPTSHVASMRYRLGSLSFEERFTFPARQRLDTGAAFEATLELLFVCAGLSYFKAAAPPVVEGVPDWTVGFLRDLLLHGLAEYAMTNDLAPITPELRTTRGRAVPTFEPRDAPAIVAIGGGKDSLVTIESMFRAERPALLASVNTHRVIEAQVSLSGFDYLVIGRRLDPRLIELNDQGARNGHVPVTAINSCALAALASGLGAGDVVMSNELSASVPVATHRGLPVNHQWSKGLECEQALAALLPVRYFSLLRPLHEVEIARRFAGLDTYFRVVTSCNQAYTAAGRAAGVRWCGVCPKCRFVFLALAPFLEPVVLQRIFQGKDLLADAAAVDGYRAILGLGGEPPLDCVGTVHESRWALDRLCAEPAWRQHPVVRALGPEVNVVAGWDPLRERGPHRIPDDWLEVADALA